MSFQLYGPVVDRCDMLIRNDVSMLCALAGAQLDYARMAPHELSRGHVEKAKLAQKATAPMLLTWPGSRLLQNQYHVQLYLWLTGCKVMRL